MGALGKDFSYSVGCIGEWGEVELRVVKCKTWVVRNWGVLGARSEVGEGQGLIGGEGGGRGRGRGERERRGVIVCMSYLPFL